MSIQQYRTKAVELINRVVYYESPWEANDSDRKERVLLRVIEELEGYLGDRALEEEYETAEEELSGM